MALPDPTLRGTTRRRSRYRTAFRAAVAVAVAVHALLLAFLSFPGTEPRPERRALSVIPMAPAPDRAPRRSIPPPEETPRPERDRSRPTPRTAIPIPVESPGAPIENTIPETALEALREAVLPLEAGPEGVRRRTPRADPERLARARAESLVNVRLAELPGAERRERGAVDLAAEGGVRISIPWEGFLPSDRSDEGWRKKRCSGRGDDSDKPGEAEARRAQCE